VVNDDCSFFLLLMNAANYGFQEICYETRTLSIEAAEIDSIGFKSGRLLSYSTRLVLQNSE
jgi:hypothetical protein